MATNQPTGGYLGASRIREDPTGTPTVLDVRAIGDGELLQRVGTTVVGLNPSGVQACQIINPPGDGADVYSSACPDTDHPTGATENNYGTDALLESAVSKVIAHDTIEKRNRASGLVEVIEHYDCAAATVLDTATGTIDIFDMDEMQDAKGNPDNTTAAYNTTWANRVFAGEARIMVKVAGSTTPYVVDIQWAATSDATAFPGSIGLNGAAPNYTLHAIGADYTGVFDLSLVYTGSVNQIVTASITNNSGASLSWCDSYTDGYAGAQLA